MVHAHNLIFAVLVTCGNSLSSFRAGAEEFSISFDRLLLDRFNIVDWLAISGINLL